MRLSDDKALPFERVAVSADLRLGVLIWTSKVGLRLIDQKKLKFDANGGVRFWRIGEKLNFNPSPLGLSFNPSQSWADPLIGGRVQYFLSPKVVVTALGDVGGWSGGPGVGGPPPGSRLDYQFVTALGYKLNPRYTLQAGYRYLFLDYRYGRNGSSVTNVVIDGVLFGATINLKPKKGD
jgi:hypothetical protein